MIPYPVGMASMAGRTGSRGGVTQMQPQAISEGTKGLIAGPHQMSYGATGAVGGANAPALPGPQAPSPAGPNGVTQAGGNAGQLIGNGVAAGTVGFGGNALGNYGGSPTGANNVFNYDAAAGQQIAGRAAPQAGNAQTQQDYGLQNQALAAQQQGMASLAQTANGQGPAITAARQQLATNTQQGQSSTTAIANSAQGGGRGLAAAGGNASLQNAQSQGGLGQQQSQLQAQMQAQAAQQYQSAAQGYASSAAGLQNSELSGAYANASLAQQQQQQNQAGQLGMLGLANSAQTSQLGIQGSDYNSTLQGDQAQAQQNAQKNNATTGAVIGGAEGLGMAALAFA